MNYKHNINYFQSGDKLKILGAALALAGGFSFVIIWSYTAYLLSYITVPVGLFLFFWRTGRCSNDQDIEDAIEEQCATVKIDWAEDKKLSARRAKSFEPIIIRGYEYEDGVLLKKMKNGALCSSRCTVAEIAVLEDALYLKTKSFSLIAEEESEQTLELPFSEMTSIELTDEEKRFPYQKTFLRVIDHRLVFRYGENRVLSFPVNHDLGIENFVERIQILLKDESSTT